jgi:hypothetical protein
MKDRTRREGEEKREETGTRISIPLGGVGQCVRDIVLKLLMRDACCQEPPMGDHGIDGGSVPEDVEDRACMGAPSPYPKPGGGAG